MSAIPEGLCDGCVSVFIGRGILDQSRQNPDESKVSFRIAVWNGMLRTTTRLVKPDYEQTVAGQSQKVCHWNESLHLPVHVYDETRHPGNSLVFVLESREGKKDKELAHFIYHLYDIVPRVACKSAISLTKSELQTVVRVDVKVEFVYGIFGYGRSPMIELSGDAARQQTQEVLHKRTKCLFPFVEMAGKRTYRDLFRSKTKQETGDVPSYTSIFFGKKPSEKVDPENDLPDLRKLWVEILGLQDAS